MVQLGIEGDTLDLLLELMLGNLHRFAPLYVELDQSETILSSPAEDK